MRFCVWFVSFTPQPHAGAARSPSEDAEGKRSTLLVSVRARWLPASSDSLCLCSFSAVSLALPSHQARRRLSQLAPAAARGRPLRPLPGEDDVWHKRLRFTLLVKHEGCATKQVQPFVPHLTPLPHKMNPSRSAGFIHLEQVVIEESCDKYQQNTLRQKATFWLQVKHKGTASQCSWL